jgi:hypothetical protein
MDDATKFIINVGEADLIYLDGLAKYPDISIGAAQFPEYLYFPQPVKDLMSKLMSDLLYPTIKKIVNTRVEALKEMAANVDNVDCIHDEMMFDLKEYLIQAEVPFAISVVKDTPLKDSIKLPDNLYERIDQMRKIPLCRKHHPVATETLKAII